MLFNSLDYLLFFPLVVILYYGVPHRLRWVLLLCASYYFYMSWRAEYAILIAISTLVDFVAGLQIGRNQNPLTRKLWLALSLSVNLGFLFTYKYFNFFSESVTAALSQLNIFIDSPHFDALLPVGISFYTFQTMSYTIDVYRGRKEPETHLGIFATYVAFFPQLVAGPIERAVNLLPQFYERHQWDSDRVVSGLRLMGWGLFKKVVIADRLATVVNTIYNNPTEFTGIPLWLGTYFFAFQIFCDFSGYSDIAIGTARVLGFDLMENFRRPYFATSIRDFWGRWHISLSTWFRDYLYIPLGGNRVTTPRWLSNILVVFLVSGLWHGANWTFVIWGALHGVYQLIAIVLRNPVSAVENWLGLPKWPRLHRLLQMLLTFHLVVFAWVFFRANTVGDAFYIVRNLFVGLNFSGSYGLDVGGWFELTIIGMSLLIMEGVHAVAEWGNLPQLWRRQTLVLRWAAYYVLIFVVLLFGKFGVAEFIYFQF